MKIKTTHIRYRNGIPVQYSRKSKGSIDAKGGITFVTVEKDGKIYSGKAICSLADQFSYKTGRELAVKRALKNA
jgi:hypothetical protein